MKIFLKPPAEFRNGHKDRKRLALIHLLPCVVCKELGLKQTSRTIAHHKIGKGIGKKASDLLSMALCNNHHNTSPEGIHNMPLSEWEKRYFFQDRLIEITNQMLEEIR